MNTQEKGHNKDWFVKTDCELEKEKRHRELIDEVISMKANWKFNEKVIIENNLSTFELEKIKSVLNRDKIEKDKVRISIENNELKCYLCLS